MNRSVVTDNRFGFTQPTLIMTPRRITDPAMEQVDNNNNNNTTTKQQSQQERPPRKRLRSIVQFDNVCEIFSPDPAMEDIHSQNETEMVNHHHHPAEDAVSSSPFWYSQQDYQQFKATALADAKQVTEASPKIKSRIRQAFQVFTATTTAATATPEEHPDSDGNQTLLHPEWEKHTPLHGCCEAVGLEYLVDRNVYRHRKRLRRMLLDAVDQIQKTTPLETAVEVQQEQKEQHQCLLLRRVCEDLSGPSKQFAHYVGSAAAATADTRAMKLDEDLEVQ